VSAANKVRGVGGTLTLLKEPKVKKARHRKIGSTAGEDSAIDVTEAIDTAPPSEE